MDFKRHKPASNVSLSAARASCKPRLCRANYFFERVQHEVPAELNTTAYVRTTSISITRAVVRQARTGDAPIPERWLRGERSPFTLAARESHRTDYRGIDPEVLSRSDQAVTPPSIVIIAPTSGGKHDPTSGA